MEGSSSSSFIPKQNPRRSRRAGGKRVYFFTLVSYVVFVASLIAAIGVFIYQQYVTTQLAKEVEALSMEVARFNEADMSRIKEFDARLEKAQERLDYTVDMGKVFGALEDTIVETARISALDLERVGDSNFSLTATIGTEDLGSAISQREAYEQNASINQVALENISIAGSGADVSAENVTLTAQINVPLADVLYEVLAVDSFPVPESFDPVETDVIDDETVFEEEVVSTTTEDEAVSEVNDV